MELIRRLEQLGRGDLVIAGGKGANLGALVGAGLPVPPGFVVLTSAYRRFVESNALQAELERLLGTVSPEDPGSTERASVAIREAFAQGRMPEEVALAEKVSAAELQTHVAERRRAYGYWLTVIPAETIGPDLVPLAEDVSDKQVLQGTAASGGRVRGRARIVHDVREALRLTAGDILITRATDPGWTPVFPLVGGIVLEIGGQLSHGAIVAREYAIPAVVNVTGAMRHIRDGQPIIVDGGTGQVFLDTEAAAA